MSRLTRRAALRTTAAATAGAGALVGCSAAEEEPFTRHRYEERVYWRYVPPGHDGSQLPLVVMLHGCSQDPREFAEETRMNALADEEGFAVVYPEQTEEANASRCWNWFDPDHQQRGAGEPALIAGTTRETIADVPIDESRVYLAGFSAGAAMAPIMAVAYPDVYEAVGVHSGLEYDAADDPAAALVAMQTGGPDPQEKGTQAYEDMYDPAVVRTVVFHGTDDSTVAPVNGHQAAEQATQTIDLAADGVDDDGTDYEPDESTTRESDGHTYHVRRYADEDGRVLVAKYVVEGMGHAWAGGAEDGRYTDPDAPDASRIVWEFFDG